MFNVRNMLIVALINNGGTESGDLEGTQELLNSLEAVTAVTELLMQSRRGDKTRESIRLEKNSEIES